VLGFYGRAIGCGGGGDIRHSSYITTLHYRRHEHRGSCRLTGDSGGERGDSRSGWGGMIPQLVCYRYTEHTAGV